SLPEIGQFFGGKDHSTVIHSCNTIEQKKEKDPELKARIEALEAQLGGTKSSRSAGDLPQG
ncbi:MAG: helix-turn-helix domain-containing protein, partial [Bdellovibrionota bacterium]